MISSKIKILLVLLLWASACGSVQVQNATESTSETPETSESAATTPDSEVFIFASDYSSSGQLYKATLTGTQTALVNSGLALLGTEAVIQVQNDLLYILHAGASFNSFSTDNLQIVDPFDTNASYRTLGQFSTGNGTNPVSLLVQGQTAYISLRNPEADPKNVDAQGNPGDVIAMNTQTGEITARYSFFDFLDDDGDKKANAYRMVWHENVLYVLIQDLASVSFSSDSPGLLGRIDTRNKKVLGATVLSGRNPSDLIFDSDKSHIIISFSHNLKHDGSFGGLEVLDRASLQSEAFITDDNWGGYVENLARHGSQVFGVAGHQDAGNFTFISKVIGFDEEFQTADDIETVIPFADDSRSFFVQNGKIWVSYRVISTSQGESQPSIKVFDSNGQQQGDALFPVVGGISMTGK